LDLVFLSFQDKGPAGMVNQLFQTDFLGRRLEETPAPGVWALRDFIGDPIRNWRPYA
jgi:hypothetical protein